MTREELKEHCEKQIEMCEMWAIAKGEEPRGKVYEEHKLILELLEQQRCEKCISMADVEQTIEDNILCYTHSDQDSDTECHRAIRAAFRMLRKDLRKLPPVTPKISTGKWIYKNYNWYCSECGCTPKTLGYIGDAEFMKEHFKFCNHCGAMMLDAVMTEDEEEADEESGN